MLSANQIAGFLNQLSRTNRFNSLIFCMLMQILKNQNFIEEFWLGMAEVCGANLVSRL